MKVKAHLKHLNISPRKVRIVVNNLRGLGALEALGRLDFTQKRAARPLSKLLRSAIANAENNFSLDRESLKIDELRVDGGPILKRFRPKSKGRAAPIWHRTSHITVTLEGKRAVGDKIKTEQKKKQEISDEIPNVSNVDQDSPVQSSKEVVFEKSASRRSSNFEIEKKVGSVKKPSFVRKFFRRKSI